VTQLYLALVDTAGIQSYIFGSNRLRENVGASHLVYMATAGWLLTEPDALLPAPHNIRAGQIAPDVQIEQTLPDGQAVAAELLHTGGGNAAILFRSEGTAQDFARRLSGRLLTDAPGLDAVLVVEPCTWGDSLAATMERAHKQLAAVKAGREWSQPLLGLGVTASCRSTGLPANYLAQEPGGTGERVLPVSAKTWAKWRQNEPARRRLASSVTHLDGTGLEIPDQFDHLGRTAGDFSYMGVVHADGNNVGKAVQALTARYRSESGQGNRRYIEALRTFSDQVNAAGLAALNECIGAVVRVNLSRDGVLPPFVDRQGREYVSMRPIVFGGDDVTFVCDGRIALRAAQVYLEAFHRQRIPNADGELVPAVAAAGVAIVKSSYPFARAYMLSEALCKNAKNSVGRQAPALDWHMAQGGLFGSLGEIRQSEYGERRDENGEVTQSLLMHPVTVGADPVLGWRTWQSFAGLQREFRQKWPKSKLMALRETLRQGDAAVRTFTRNYGALPQVIGLEQSQYPYTGWHERRCVYFDAIDMIEQEVDV
jgi:hypothetical protein